MDYDERLEPTTAFYRVTGEDLKSGRGHLIKSETLTGAAALADADASYRVIYESTSGITGQLDKPIGVSGIIAFPAQSARAGGWPVVSWAHGTVGSADICAPSMDEYVQADFGEKGLGLLRNINRAPHKLLNAFLRNGWAVAMTDYEGCGCYGNHPYLLGESEGRGILDIVPALHELAAAETGETVSDQYVIVGHSQGGQAALFGASLAGSYATPGTFRGVAALAPASNLTGDRKPIGLARETGLWQAYRVLDPVPDLAGFFALFTNGVRGGDPEIELDKIFQPAAQIKYLDDYDTKSRAEMSDLLDFWARQPPRVLSGNSSIFTALEDSAEIADMWRRYWDQVDNFSPEVTINAPIRISQANGDTRVRPAKTTLLLGELRHRNAQVPITDKFYGTGEVMTPDPPVPVSLGEHFGLLGHGEEIEAVVAWAEERLS